MTVLSEQAADWIVRLSGDDADDRERARIEFEQWKKADASHAASAAGMEQLIGQVQGLRECSRPARIALGSASARRRALRRSGAGAALLLVLALPLIALQQARQPFGYWLADLRSDTGEWSVHTLPDGSRLTLDSGSAVNLHFDRDGRVVELVRGAVLVDVAHDRARSFRVETEHGAIRALGTRFAVTHAAELTQLDMLESRVAVRSAEHSAKYHEPIEVAAGQRVRIYFDRIEAAEPIDARSIDDAWLNHQLVVQDEPLAGVLERLARHRSGTILFDRDELADIRVSAVLPLDDTDRALQLLAKNFPALRVGTITRWLVTVQHAEPE